MIRTRGSDCRKAGGAPRPAIGRGPAAPAGGALRARPRRPAPLPTALYLKAPLLGTPPTLPADDRDRPPAGRRDRDNLPRARLPARLPTARRPAEFRRHRLRDRR